MLAPTIDVERTIRCLQLCNLLRSVQFAVTKRAAVLALAFADGLTESSMVADMVSSAAGVAVGTARVKSMGGAAQVIGKVAGGLLASVNPRACFLVAACCCLLHGGAVCLALGPETGGQRKKPPPASDTHAPANGAGSWCDWRRGRGAGAIATPLQPGAAPALCGHFNRSMLSQPAAGGAKRRAARAAHQSGQTGWAQSRRGPGRTEDAVERAVACDTNGPWVAL